MTDRKNSPPPPRGEGAGGGGRRRQSRLASANASARRLRGSMAATERHFWKTLRGMESPSHFRKQVPIGPYVVDFVCHAAKLVIELDGYFHEFSDARKRDGERDAWLTSQGYRVLRFRNSEVWDEIERVLDEVRAAIPPTLDPSPTGGEGSDLQREAE